MRNSYVFIFVCLIVSGLLTAGNWDHVVTQGGMTFDSVVWASAAALAAVFASLEGFRGRRLRMTKPGPKRRRMLIICALTFVLGVSLTLINGHIGKRSRINYGEHGHEQPDINDAARWSIAFGVENPDSRFLGNDEVEQEYRPWKSAAGATHPTARGG